MVLFLPVSIPMNNLGLNVAGFSYSGTLWVCVTVCRQMMPDPAVFATSVTAIALKSCCWPARNSRARPRRKLQPNPKPHPCCKAQKKAAPAATSAARSQPVAVKPPVQKIAAAKPVVKPTTKKAAKATTA